MFCDITYPLAWTCSLSPVMMMISLGSLTRVSEASCIFRKCSATPAWKVNLNSSKNSWRYSFFKPTLKLVISFCWTTEVSRGAPVKRDGREKDERVEDGALQHGMPGRTTWRARRTGGLGTRQRPTGSTRSRTGFTLRLFTLLGFIATSSTKILVTLLGFLNFIQLQGGTLFLLQRTEVLFRSKYLPVCKILRKNWPQNKKCLLQ